MADKNILLEIARDIRLAESSLIPVDPIRSRLVDFGIDDAYEIQKINVEHAVANGRRIVGRKIGLTNPRVQSQLGVDQPDFGTLFADMCYGDNQIIPSALVMQPKIEAEVAFILKQDIDIPDCTCADLIQAIDWVVPALEVVGSRIKNWDIKFVDTVADNASSGVFVLGGAARKLDGIELSGLQMIMTRNGEVISEGSGVECLGSPLNSTVWLAKTMSKMGTPLRAGDVVLSGALGPMVPMKPGDCFVAEISGLGRVSTEIAI